MEHLKHWQSSLQDHEEISWLYPNHLRLKSLHVFMRHGHRTPLRNIQPFGTSWNLCHDSEFKAFVFRYEENSTVEFPLKYETVDGNSAIGDSLSHFQGNCYNGQLTDLGRRSMSAFGTVFKEFYVKQLGFLPEIPTGDQVFLRSTDFNRTIESLQSFVKGAFPSPAVHYTIHTRREEDENLYDNSKYCPRLKTLLSQFKGSYQKNSLSGQSHSSHFLYDNLICRLSHDIPISTDELPLEKLHQLESEAVEEWFSRWDLSSASHPDLPQREEAARLGFGRLLKEINGKLYDPSSSNKLLHVYAAHDTTIGGLLSIFQLYKDKKWPPFGSNLVLELLETSRGERTDGSSFVRLKYNGKPLQLPFCRQDPLMICPLEVFTEYIQKLFPLNYKEECK